MRHEPGNGVLIVKVGHRFVAVIAQTAPVLVTGHDGIEDLAADYEANGYFDPRRRSTEAPVLAMRFNLEMSRSNRAAAAIADDATLAVARAQDALADHRSPHRQFSRACTPGASMRSAT